MTSLGSQVEPLMMIISTQAASDAHLLSELIDYGLKIQQGEIEDDSFTVHLYTSPIELPLDDRKGWYAANPSLGDYRDLKEFEQTIFRAMKVPSLEASIRNLYLNQRVQAKAPFLTPNVWKLNEGAVNDALFYDCARAVFGGLDLSARTDLSALVWAVEDDEENVHLRCRVWTPQDTIFERGARDRAPYPAWAEQEKLIPVPGAALDYDFIAADMADDAATMPNVARVAYDPWRIAILKQSFQRLGIAIPLVEMGQGFKAISPCIDAFEELALRGKLRHGGHPVLRWCISNAVVTRDAADNRKLDKSKAFGRIDVAQAAVMAVGAMKVNTETILDLAAMIG
jgi:phage terminase large subunit-like protein